MTKKSFLLTALCACALLGCNEGRDTDQQGSFRFSAICHNYSGGSSMMAAGDSAGIFVGAPIQVINRKGTMEGSGYLVFSPGIRTIEGSADSAAVCAYTPYTQELSDGRTTFSVREDQRDKAAFNASCLCTARAKLVAGDNSKATKLQFYPVMAQLSIRITNLTDSPVSSVLVKGLKGSVTLDTTDGTITATGSKTDFLAYADPDSAGIYKLFLAPQNSTVAVTAELENGDGYDFGMIADLCSGKVTGNYSDPFVIESKIGPVKPEDFGTVTVPGVYFLNSEVLSPILTYTAGQDQYATSGTGASRMFRLQNLNSGWMYRLDISPSQLTEGASVSISAQAVGCATLDSGSYSATVVQTDKGMAWICCADAELGFIIKTE